MKNLLIKDIANVVMGQSPKGDSVNDNGEGVPFMQGNRTFGLKYPKIDSYTTQPKKFGYKNSTIMSVRAPVGDVNKLDNDTCLGRGLCSIESKTCEDEFLYYLIKYYSKFLSNTANGTVFTSVNKQEIENLKVAIPNNIESRNSIAEILNNLDKKIILNNQLNDYLAA